MLKKCVRQKHSFLFLFAILIINTGLNANDLPVMVSDLFSGAGNCAACHISGNDIFTTTGGTDISPTTLWRSSMMANAARDPLWQAKVAAEVNEHPALQTIIEDKCTTCHSPMGRTEAIYDGANNFSLSEALVDPLSLDGVSCTLCHQIQQENMGKKESYSGGYEITNIHEIYGPYDSPLTMPMFNQSGYTPVYSASVNRSELCATCHTLFTPYVDNQGQVAGYFAEQTPYLEWKNSNYPTESVTCQTCHLPATNEAMKIAISPPWLTTQRSPIWRHEFVGGNVFMNTLLKTNGESIGVTASGTHFDSTVSRTTRLLQEQTVELAADAQITDDTLYINVLVENLIGHKFPTGFPSRRAWLYTSVKNNDQTLVFESGNLDGTGEISGLDQDFEPHHNIITDPGQVQVYQSVMKDVDGEVTYTLLRGAEYAKDNRLPPKGFTTVNPVYDSVAIIGAAATDVDFNRDDEGQQGSGSDRVHYKFSVAGQGQTFTVTVSMYYQTLAPEFARDLFSHQDEKITTFKNYYDNADNTPVTLKSVSLTVANLEIRRNEHMQPKELELLANYPNPFNPATKIYFRLPKAGHVTLKVFDVLGHEAETLINDFQPAGDHEISFDGQQLSSGVYFYRLQFGKSVNTGKMLLLK